MSKTQREGGREEEMISVLVPIIFIVASLTLGRYALRKDSRFPPGNMGWPLIGETLSLLKPHPSTWRGEFLENRIPMFGKIFSSMLLGKQTIVSADPELSQLILKNTGTKFEIDWPPNLAKLMSEFAVILLAGDAHKYMRSVILSFLSTEKFRTVFLRDAEQIASQLVGNLKDGSVISAIDVANKFSFYFMVKQVLGMDFGEPMVEKIRGEYKVFARGLAALPIYVPGTNYWKAFQSREYILNFIKQMTEERIHENRNGDERTERHDFLSFLVKNTEQSKEQISGLLLNLLFAGHHTTSKAISSMFYFLEGCPEAIKKLREEHLQVIEKKQLKGETGLTWDDYKDMEFAQCVYNETLRLSNIAPLIFRKSTTDFYFKEYLIPRGCSVIIHTAGMHLDSTLFEGPGHFNPWRWLHSSGINKNDAFMPFGGGSRLCAGNVLARMQIIVFLQHLIMKYDWELVEHDYPISSPTIEFSKFLNVKIQTLSPKIKKM